jgi:hypothetical protein
MRLAEWKRVGGLVVLRSLLEKTRVDKQRASKS